MKHNMNRILTTMALLVLTTITAWAEQKVKITVTPENSGTVTYEIVNGSSVKLTCKPGNGYWLSKDYIKAVTSLDGGAVQAPQKRIPVDEGTELTITDGEGNTDVAGETTYYFDLPADQNLNVEVTATFQSRTSIEGATVTVVYPDGGIIYNGEEQKPAIASVVLAGTTLTSADYTVSGYSNNINVGNEAEVTVEGQGKYTGSATGKFTISKADLSTVTVGAIDDQTFTGAEIKPAVTVTFNGKAVAEDEYSVAYSNNINAGTATVTLTSKDKSFSTAKTKTATFKIVAKALTADMVADIAAQAYTGSPLTPAVTVTDGDAILVVGEDYAVSYADNVNVGVNTATATVTGMGNYTGSVVKTFSITAVAATVKKAPEALNPTYTASAQDLVAAGETDNGKVVYSLTADGTFTETIPQATEAGSYTVYYKATGDANHTESAVGNVTAPIAKADLSTVTVGAIADQTFNGAEIKPAVTVTFNGKAVAEDEYSVAYSDNTNAGTATVTLTSKDKNFSTEKTKTATFKINPAKATLSFDKSEVTAAVNETPEWPVLNNPQGAIIAYTSSKPEVATVDETTGSVEMKGVGTTTIKAAINDPNYQYADASYTLTVTSYAYNLKIDGMVVTDENREELFEKSVMFDGKATLTLTDAKISGIESGLDTLEIYVIGENIIDSETDYAIWDMTGGKQYLHIYTDMTAPGKLDLNSKTQVVSGFKEISIKEPMTIIAPDYVSYLNEEGVTYVLLGSPLDPIVDNGNKNNNVDYGSGGGVDDKTLTNTIVDNVLYTLNDTQEPNKDDDGVYNGMLIINSVMDDDELENALQMTPTTDEFAENFKGITFMVPAGSGTVSITAYTKLGHALCISVGGKQPPYLLQTLGATLTFDYSYTCTSATYIYIYHIQLSDVAGAPDMDNHRIGPKATVSTGITGLSVSASNIDTPPGGKPNYLCMSKDDLMIPEDGVGHIIVENGDITDLGDDTFDDLTGNGEGDQVSKRAASDYDITYIDLRGTSITGKEYSRKEGPFKGIPVTTFIYLPAGNVVHSPNMVVGSVCDSLVLGDEDHTFEVAEGGFSASRAIFERPFDADKKLPLYLPFGIENPERYGTFFELDKIENNIVSMKKAESVEANKPYYLQLKEDGEEIIDELGVKVEPLEGYSDSKFVGTYELRSLYDNSYVYDNDAKKFRYVSYGYAVPFEAYLTGIYNMDDTLVTQWEGEPVTSVKGISAETTEEDQWYTLDGRQLQQQPNRKGVYLKGGKKRIVK